MHKQNRGFTVIELIIVASVLALASVVFFIQKNNVQVAARDNERKTAINALYYSLEEVFFKANGYYPQTISQTNLPSVDPTLFTDPAGNRIGTAVSNYRYEPINCTDSKCKSYTLRTTLQNEADYIKHSQNN
jgi:prepilin-type N-terminal cleavage/methylation domain-containing protein